MSNQTSEERLAKLAALPTRQDQINMIYQWTKTGLLSRTEFTKALEMLTQEKANV